METNLKVECSLRIIRVLVGMYFFGLDAIEIQKTSLVEKRIEYKDIAECQTIAEMVLDPHIMLNTNNKI